MPVVPERWLLGTSLAEASGEQPAAEPVDLDPEALGGALALDPHGFGAGG
ncbi:MAG: hypothetical protein ACRDJU_13340 [Actinomycetota bacterium]